MRSKATAIKASARGAQGNANGNIQVRENAHLALIKQIGRPTKTPTGKGLGKAGARRLGRLLKRAILDQEESTVKGRISLAKTPVRLFKHQIQTEAENGPKTTTAKPALPRVSQLILSMVSQCKHRGGMSMAELKQVLAAGGYNVTKNSRQVNVVTNRLVNNDTLVRTTRNAAFRLNNKKQTDTKQIKSSNAISPNPKGDLKQNKPASKSPKGEEKSQRRARNTTKQKGKTRKAAAKSYKPTGKTRKAAAKSYKPTGKTRKAVAKSYKPTGKTRKAVAKSHKPTGKTRKAVAKSHKPKRKTPKVRGKSAKPTGKKHRSATNRAARVRKAPRKAHRTRRRQSKQNQHPYKSYRTRQPPRRKLYKTRSRLKTQQRRVARRRAYYYYWN